MGEIRLGCVGCENGCTVASPEIMAGPKLDAIKAKLERSGLSYSITGDQNPVTMRNAYVTVEKDCADKNACEKAQTINEAIADITLSVALTQG